MIQNRPQRAALLIGCALAVLLPLILLFRGEKEISASENRALARFPAFSLSSFLSGDFQSGLENALGDQYPGSEQIKNSVLDWQNGISRLEAAVLRAVSPGAGLSYTEITPGYYHFAGDARRIVEKPWSIENTAAMQARSEAFNHASGVKKYVYFIRNSRAQDFTAGEQENNAAYETVKSAYQADGYAQFSAADYAEFSRLFYQTDHHWNHVGADQGYRQILSLLGVEEAPIAPEKEWIFNVVFNGSYARQTKTLCADEVFSAYAYDTGRLKTTLSGKRGQYGHQALYEKDRYPTDELRNHYAYYYGGDYGEILIDNGSSHGKNLLVIADSYSNPINLLLASHFDQTCIIDLRYYAQDMGKAFDLNAYIADHDIDTLLMMGDIGLFSGAQEEEAGR